MNALLPLIAAVVLAGCSAYKEETAFKHPAYRAIAMNTLWIPVRSLEDVRRICGGSDDPNLLGCALKPTDDLCVVVTQLPPVHEYSGAISTHKSELWVVLGHELAHCYGWEHVPGLVPASPPPPAP